VEEIAPGVWHWSALRESIGHRVSSYYLAEERIAIDPMLPPEQPEWFRPEHAILTCRHHDREAWQIGCPVWVVEQGAQELEGRGEFRTYEWGDELPGGVVAHEVDALSPDETALHIPVHRALAVGDAVIRWEPDDPLGFVPDRFMDDPERDKAGLRTAFERLLELDFELLLLGHGNPVVGGAKEQLRALVQV
jgi:glyoxylase-like metal-dependent hydrolase (beta-lactamase superfamily II)